MVNMLHIALNFFIFFTCNDDATLISSPGRVCVRVSCKIVFGRQERDGERNLIKSEACARIALPNRLGRAGLRTGHDFGINEPRSGALKDKM